MITSGDVAFRVLAPGTTTALGRGDSFSTASA